MGRFSMLCSLTLALLFAIGECKVSDELRVTLPHGGGLTGRYLTSHRGRGIRAFQGIPYAEPPVGELRFTSPIPKLPWEGYIAATDSNRQCPQLFGDGVIGDEDCLYLNVYTPLNPTTKGPLPVMMFIHGGGFVTGSASSEIYDPGYILDHDVVLVTINYRLGTLGFLSLGTSDLPGNFGLKDQHLALQWLHDNIEVFNGDVKSITIFGESAGSASVAYHLLSKSSYKLFHRAILQSGTQYSPWAFDNTKSNTKKAFALGKALDCPITDAKADFESFTECLRTKTPEQLITAFDRMATGFLPTAEESLTGFLQKSPAEYIRSHGLDIPIMIGVTSEEGALFTALFANNDLNNIFNMDESLINSFINGMTAAVGLDSKGQQRVQKAVKEFYFKSGRFEKEHLENVTNFFSDGHFIAGVDEFLVNRLVTNENSADTYVYLFSHRGAVSGLDLFPAFGLPAVDLDEDLGVSHIDDLIYLFPVGERAVSHIVPTKVDALIQMLLTEMWVNFAKTGKPSSPTFEDLTWTPARGYPLDFLRVGNYKRPELDILGGMDKGLLEDRLQFWRHLKSINQEERKRKEDGRDEL